eukprot:CAMPEP_0173060776 /NCGR_PEP_ID=MMETSP1102-20130122/2807_1 /TAXON_ID=49646 /ORGANISM="Geminigera sp., Strain Caron Lab Isolate" /LENGTH=64 /DNA_ID=CAMNT_0013927087 /DNA_START=1019 /DNA_END=1210 /DNA_ORIENTATION=-
MTDPSNGVTAGKKGRRDWYGSSILKIMTGEESNICPERLLTTCGTNSLRYVYIARTHVPSSERT